MTAEEREVLRVNAIKMDDTEKAFMLGQITAYSEVLDDAASYADGLSGVALKVLLELLFRPKMSELADKVVGGKGETEK